MLASTDIALRLLMRLGAEPNRLRTAGELSQAVGAPLNHLHKIIQDLAEAGLVRTLRGARGGVLLARPVTEIRIGEVVRRLEEGQALVECFRLDGGTCRLSPDCRLRGVLARGRTAFFAEIDAVTLADCLSS